jgi:hypothetical protein
LEGALLHRPSPSFFEEADAVSGELQFLATLFCESNGTASRIHHEMLDNDPDTVRQGGFLHLERVAIDPQHRGKDLGLRFIHEVLMALNHKWTLAVMEPYSLRDFQNQWSESFSSADDEWIGSQQAKTQAIQRHFLRMGFAQAGNSNGREKAWFLTRTTYMANADPIKSWLSKEDSKKIIIHEPPVIEEPKGLDKELRDAIGMACADENAMDEIHRLIKKGASIEKAKAMHVAAALEQPIVLRELAKIGGNIEDCDENGNTPLHVAAACFRPNIIRYLLEMGADAKKTNAGGETPLQSLQKALQSLEDMCAAFSLGFGLAPRAIDVEPRYESLFLLMPNKSLLTDSWMSPRMHKVLSITADLEADSSQDESSCRLEYIPESVLRQRKNTAKFVAGMNCVWNAVSKVLQSKQTPTIQRVTDLVLQSSDVRDFFAQGGMVDHVIDSLVTISRNVVKNGDDGWEYEMFEDDITALPSTVFDEDFELAWHRLITLGGGTIMTRGPYHGSSLYNYGDVPDDADDEMLDGDHDEYGDY